MPVIGVIGRKGGSGKTTIAVHLAAVFATQGKNVALVDADTQGSATYWAEPGHLPMQVVHRPLEHDREILAWSIAVRGIDADLLVLDAPPHLNEALGGVIGLSDLVVIPCGPSGLDLIATGEAVGLVRQIRDERGDGKPAILLVPNRVDRRTTAGRDLAGALKDLGEPVGAVHRRPHGLRGRLQCRAMRQRIRAAVDRAPGTAGAGKARANHFA